MRQSPAIDAQQYLAADAQKQRAAEGERSALQMFCHIDESGNTSNNLFDSAQPRLNYGAFSSVINVDALCVGIHRQILREIGDEQIHTNQVGFGGLVKIALHLIEIQKNEVRFRLLQRGEIRLCASSFFRCSIRCWAR